MKKTFTFICRDGSLYPAGIYLFNVRYRKTEASCEIRSKSLDFTRCSLVSIVDLEQVNAA